MCRIIAVNLPLAPRLRGRFFKGRKNNLSFASPSIRCPTIYQMLSTGEQWNPSDLYKIDMPAPMLEKQKAKAIKQAKKLLQKEGLLPPDEPLAS